MNKTEATVSWDVSGYYMYLPTYFIYKDLKNCSFQNDIINKYQPSPQFDQDFKYQRGNYVMNYPIISVKRKSIQIRTGRNCKITRINNIRIYEVGISYFGRTYKEGKNKLESWH